MNYDELSQGIREDIDRQIEKHTNKLLNATLIEDVGVSLGHAFNLRLPSTEREVVIAKPRETPEITVEDADTYQLLEFSQEWRDLICKLTPKYKPQVELLIHTTRLYKVKKGPGKGRKIYRPCVLRYYGFLGDVQQESNHSVGDRHVSVNFDTGVGRGEE